MGEVETCPQCGAKTKDKKWCDECGAHLANDDSQVNIGDTIIAKGAEEKTISLKMERVIENYPTNRTFLAKAQVSNFPNYPEGIGYIVEEKRVAETRDFAIPDAVSSSFVQPFASLTKDERRFDVYRELGGLNLAEIVSTSQGRLTLNEIESIFSSICEAVIKVNSRGFLVLALSPWTIRLLGPEFEADFIHEPQKELIPTLEHEINPSEVEGIVEEISEGRTTLPASEPARTRSLEYSVLFEGIDFIVRMNDEPEEVPVIMGFSGPEFFGPFSRQIDLSCDVFALGMVLYFLVSGRLPPSSAKSRHCPAFGARSFRNDFSPGLQTVISKATQVEQKGRFQSVSELLNAFSKAVVTSRQRRRLPGEPIPHPMIVSSVETHVGISKKRRNPKNQDAVFQGVSNDGGLSLFLVADGVSTASFGSGDIASHFLSEAAERMWEKVLSEYLLDCELHPRELISEILKDANQNLVDYVNEKYPDFAGNPHEVMGSTALFSIYYEGMMTIASLGDSRIYLHDSLGIEQLTTDHNLWTLSIIEGVAPDSAMSIPHGEALARCVGSFHIKEDGLYAIPPEPDFFDFVVLPGDTILMTTDGLIDYAGSDHQESERMIIDILENGNSPDIQCLELVLAANKGGGGDNIGVAILRFI